MPRTILSPEDALTLLAAAPARIAEATAGLAPAQLRKPPRPGEWSVNDVLAHIRACADVRGGAIGTILSEEHPTIRARNPRQYMTTTDYPDLEFGDSFRAFRKQRAELVALLTKLPRTGWARWATVVGAGKALRRSVLFYADWVAVHERPHLKQIAEASAALRRA